MKKILIIQQDSAYFLFETFQVLDSNRQFLKKYQLTVLVNEVSLKELQTDSVQIISGITTDVSKVLADEFDLSINLSHEDSSFHLQSKINSSHKIGPYYENESLVVPDCWSSFYLTFKGKCPFLTFHLQDIFQHIIGIKKAPEFTHKPVMLKKIAFGLCRRELLSGEESEKLIDTLIQNFPYLTVQDISEFDSVDDLTQVLYIGPANLSALKICESGATGVFLSSHFQGFNCLPKQERHLLISSRGSSLEASKLIPTISTVLQSGVQITESPYSIYKIELEHIFGTYIKSLNKSDDNYPFYQAHVVLWNFLLNLFETNLDVIDCTPTQLEMLKNHQLVLSKLIRLYDYAMSSIDTIHYEAKSVTTSGEKISSHLKSLQEIDLISNQISQSHSLLRPILDYYRIRRGQNSGKTLLEQAQNSFLTYSEEHNALKALSELFSVTLQKNEANIF